MKHQIIICLEGLIVDIGKMQNHDHDQNHEVLNHIKEFR